jgi:predicted nucleic acid-binding protein
VSDEAFVNASPLILLARIGQLDLLKLAGGRILVLKQVQEEVAAKADPDIVMTSVASRAWLERGPVVVVPADIQLRNLGSGEAAVLSAARAASAMAVLDDLQARQCAVELGVKHIGTLGLLLRARQLRVLPQVKPVVEALLKAGMYLSPGVVREVLKLAGE